VKLDFYLYLGRGKVEGSNLGICPPLDFHKNLKKEADVANMNTKSQTF
jgi:hypothetical protein